MTQRPYAAPVYAIKIDACARRLVVAAMPAARTHLPADSEAAT